MNDREEYIKQLEAIISKFLEPLKGIPYPIAIKALTGCEVLPFDLSNKENQKLLELLKTAAQIAGDEAYKQGIFTRRPNEAGNHLENLKVQVKHEFNASNKDLYKPEFLLARGKIK